MSSKGKSNDVSVQGTNDCSILSKHAMVSKGYMNDSYLKAFTLKDAPRRSPLINRGYYVRMKAVEDVLQSFLTTVGKKQVVSLGAGFDTLYFRLYEMAGGKMDDIYVVEIDFPDLVKRKAALIKSDTLTSRCVSDQPSEEKCSDNILYKLSPSYSLIGADLSETQRLGYLLSHKTQLQQDLPTFILSECVMTYMDHKMSTELIEFLCEFFPRSVFVTYEQINPWDAFGVFMRGHFDKMNSSLKAITTFSSIQLQCERYRTCGYKSVNAFTMRQFYNSLPTSERDRVTSLEDFDEFEEWHLKCNHYCLVLARGSDSFVNLEQLISSTTPDTESAAGRVSSPSTFPEELGVRMFDQRVSFYGHSSVVVCRPSGLSLLVAHGGFGETGGRHSRLNNVFVYTVDEQGNVGQQKSAAVFGNLLARIHHTMTVLSDGRVLLIGGRQSPSKPLLHPVMIDITPARGGESVEAHTVSVGPCAVECRWRHSAVLSAIEGRDVVIVTGGLSSRGHNSRPALTSCHGFDADGDQWIRIADLPRPVHSHDCCFDGERYVYLFGGIHQDERVSNCCLRLDVTQDSSQWEDVAVPLEAAYSHKMLFVDGMILVVGGIGSNGQQMGLQVMDLASTSYKHLSLPTTVDEHIFMCFNHSCHLSAARDGGTKLFIVGGGGNCFSFGTHMNRVILSFNLDELKNCQ